MGILLSKSGPFNWILFKSSFSKNSKKDLICFFLLKEIFFESIAKHGNSNKFSSDCNPLENFAPTKAENGTSLYVNTQEKSSIWIF